MPTHQLCESWSSSFRHVRTQSAPPTPQQSRFHDGVDLLVDAALVAVHAIRKTKTVAEVCDLRVIGELIGTISSLRHVLARS